MTAAMLRYGLALLAAAALAAASPSARAQDIGAQDIGAQDAGAQESASPETRREITIPVYYGPLPEEILAAVPSDRTLGRPDAPATLTVYLSTVCGHCARWHAQDLPAIRARLVDTGRIRIVWRDLPTAPPQLAYAGAMLARCAAPESYDDALGALFRGQALHLASGDVEAWLVDAADQSGLTLDQAAACLADESLLAEVNEQAQHASALGVRSTPALFLDGWRIDARTADEIEAALAPRHKATD